MQVKLYQQHASIHLSIYLSIFFTIMHKKVYIYRQDICAASQIKMFFPKCKVVNLTLV